jgi:hypothetical protein
MANLILNLLFFGGGMVFGMLLYADAIEDPDDQAIIGPLRAVGGEPLVPVDELRVSPMPIDQHGVRY